MTTGFCQRSFVVFSLILLSRGLGAIPAGGAETPSDPLAVLVREDWAAQERRHGRTPGDATAVTEAYRRARALVQDLAGMQEPPDLAAETAALAALGTQVRQIDQLDEAGRTALYYRIRSLTRDAALENPLVTGRPLTFLGRR
ncbi:MAG: hypothetical protein FJ280_19225, partial [Planctomycetes bacterium]|nr:hypothetical protein [Planctomycetota bacterium]